MTTATTTAAMTMPDQQQQQYAQVAAQIKQLLQETKVTRRDDRADAARLDELRRVFRNVAQQQDGDDFNVVADVNHDKNENEKDNSESARAKWRTFLKKSFAMMIQQLMHRIVVGGKRTAIRTLWAVVANFPIQQITPQSINNTTTAASSRTVVDRINVDLLTQWIRAISTCPSLLWKDQSVQHMIQAEFVGPFRDVQYYTMIAIATVAHQLYNNNNPQSLDNEKDDADEKDQEKKQYNSSQHAAQQQAERLVQLLMMIPIVTSQKELLDASESSKKFLFWPPAAKNAASVTNSSDNDSDDESNDDEDSDDDDDDDDDDNDESNEDSSSSEDDVKKQSSKKTTSARHYLASLQSFQRKSDHVRAWNKAWLAVLRLPCLPLHSLQLVLQFLPGRVLNIVAHPLQFADFFMQAYSMTTITTTTTSTTSHNDDSSSNDNAKKDEEKDKSQRQQHQANSIIPILALDGLFILMTKHGLEYPNYYQQLYRLVTIPLFYYKKSTSHQFFVLLEKSLVYNELLPAHVVAAFCKRLARCALQAPPATILVALALISNVLRKHPETACLIQASSSAASKSSDKNDEQINNDAFDAMTDNPVHARALQSSLWELQALTHHYLAAVATLADSIGRIEESKVAPHALQEHFLSLNYKSLFETDRKRAAIVVINNNNNNNSSSSNSNSAASATPASDDKDNKKSKKRKRNATRNSTTALTFARPENGLFGNPSDVLAGLLDIPLLRSGI